MSACSYLSGASSITPVLSSASIHCGSFLTSIEIFSNRGSFVSGAISCGESWPTTSRDRPVAPERNVSSAIFSGVLIESRLFAFSKTDFAFC